MVNYDFTQKMWLKGPKESGGGAIVHEWGANRRALGAKCLPPQMAPASTYIGVKICLGFNSETSYKI